MRAVRIDHTGHTTFVELTHEQIEAMTETQRQEEIANLRKWADGEIKQGRLVVEVEAPGAEGVQVHKGGMLRLEVFQYESHEQPVGG